MFFVSRLIGGQNGARTLNQSLIEVMQDQSNSLITFDTQLKTALKLKPNQLLWPIKKNGDSPVMAVNQSMVRAQLASHMWVEFVGSLLCTERFFSVYSGFSPLLKNQPTISYELISVHCPQLHVD